MKEYKLKQKYPSLPNDWEVGMQVGLGDRNYGYSPCSGNYTDYRKLDNNEVENNPEFWEAVLEKDYEILSFINSDNKELYYQFKNKYKTKGSIDIGTRTLDYCTKYYKIHSVKRLSDGEVFIIGDKTYKDKIYKFEHGSKIDGSDKIRVYTNRWSWDLSEIEKVKEPLLTTEEGIDLFKGDMYYFIWLSQPAINQNAYEIYSGEVSPLGEDATWSENAKFFAKKVNAERYITLNKPQYSIKDIIPIVNSFILYNVDEKTILNFLAKNGK